MNYSYYLPHNHSRICKSNLKVLSLSKLSHKNDTALRRDKIYLQLLIQYHFHHIWYVQIFDCDIRRLGFSYLCNQFIDVISTNIVHSMMILLYLKLLLLYILLSRFSFLEILISSWQTFLLSFKLFFQVLNFCWLIYGFVNFQHLFLRWIYFCLEAL